MKTETYMVVDPRHDHSFRIPRPDLSTSLGVPNACNQCHDERSPQWASAEIRKRYPQPKSGFQDFAEAFAAADRGDPAATIALTQLVANADEPAIVRASALDRLAQLGGENAVLSAEAGLKDASALVRTSAVGVFENLPPDERQAAVPLLSDPLRAVRMRAARALAPVPESALGPAADAYARASEEYVASERFNADRPENRTNLGGFFAERGRYQEAEAQFRAALALDVTYVPAWVNLADLMRLTNRESDTEALLREGLQVMPRDAMLHHVLGLSLVRQGRRDEALRELRRATELAPDNQRFAYVYGVASQEMRQGATVER
jgi:tetratricopeptide (TPR) repeat protein